MGEDWVNSTLGEVCKINMGQSPPSSTYNTEGIGLPFFQGKAEFTDLYPEVRKWCTKPKKTAEKDDILLSVRAPVGSTNIANVNCAIGRGLAAISYKYSNKFIWYYLKSVEQQLDNQGTGTTFKAISGQQLRTQEIFLPPLPIQRAIVIKLEELFSSLDSGITDLKKAQEQLKVYRQAVLKKAFQGDIFHKQKVEEIGEILTGNTPSKKHAQYYNKRDYNFYKPTDLAAGNNVFETIDFLSKEGYENSRKVPANSILVTCIGATIGKTGLVKKEGGFNQQINAIVPKGDHNHKFIYYQAIGIDFQSQIKSNASSTTLPIINKGKFSQLSMNLCSKENQERIVKEIEAKFSVCDIVEENIEFSLIKAQSTRQSILKKAFEGKLLSEKEIERCKIEHDYEPADVLLEKIKAEKKK